jgi:hypothetical protein
MLTPAQLDQYERDGCVTVDGPLSAAELTEAEAAWDRLTAVAGGGSVLTNDGEELAPPYAEAAYVDIMAHPWFEAVAQQLLRAERVHLFWGLSPHSRPPSPATAGKPEAEMWSERCHIDIQATLSDWEATPRRTRVELWHWLNDVPADRGAMRVLPGSHLPLMRAWERTLSAEHKNQLPRVHGLVPEPKGGAAAYPERLPPPPPGQQPFQDRAPTPMVATRGQVLVLCSTCLHAAWHNADTVARKAIGNSWAAAGVPCGLPASQLEGLKRFFPKLRNALPAERRHIVPAVVGDDIYFETGYDEKWEETFSWDKDAARAITVPSAAKL